jgi:hypothetical protein
VIQGCKTPRSARQETPGFARATLYSALGRFFQTGQLGPLSARRVAVGWLRFLRSGSVRVAVGRARQALSLMDPSLREAFLFETLGTFGWLFLDSSFRRNRRILGFNHTGVLRLRKAFRSPSACSSRLNLCLPIVPPPLTPRTIRRLVAHVSNAKNNLIFQPPYVLSPSPQMGLKGSLR